MDVIDFMLHGRTVANPNYDPNTKKGKLQPPTLQTNTYGISNDDAIITGLNDTNLINAYSLGNVDPDKYKEYDVTPNPVNTEEEWNKERARNQGAMEQLGHSLTQAGLGQIVYGTLEGFGTILDGMKYIATGEFDENAWTKYWREKSEKVKDDYAIYAENPDEHLRFTDWAWYMQSLPDVATTLSLMIPGAGWAKGISLVGKGIGLARASSWAVRGISRGLAVAAKGSKSAKTIDGVSKFGALRSIASNAGRTERAINTFGRVSGEALLMRTGENFMEAQQVNQEVYEQSLDNIKGMINSDKENGTNEFAKLVLRDKDFINEDGSAKSPEQIAKIIANKSSKQTFARDYWMLGMDYLQLRALGSLWGKSVGKFTKETTARERIALQNKKIEFANEKLKANGVKEEDLIKSVKDNWLNRRKANLKYMINHPVKGSITSIEALELGEGFEEGFQGVQSEKGKEVAAKIFNPNFSERSIASYLKDPEIWEQAIWGAVGGVAFGGARRGIQNISQKVDAYRKKKTMSPEDYDRWKKSTSNESITQIEGITAKANEFTEKMKTIESGYSPYKYVFDPYTGQKIYRNGEAQHETIDENQKELLKQQAIDEFVTDVALDSTDNGNIELMKELLSSREFNDFLETKGVNARPEDQALNNQVVARMNVIQGLYQQNLMDVTNSGDSANPYVNIAAARYLTRTKLKVEDLTAVGDNIQTRIDELNTEGVDYSSYEDRKLIDNINKRLGELNRQEEELNDAFGSKQISSAAYNRFLSEINKERKLLVSELNNTSVGSLDAVKSYIKGDKEFAETFEEIDEFINDYKRSLLDNNITENLPPASIQELIEQKIRNKRQQIYAKTWVPTNNQEFKDVYEDFADSMDFVYQKRLEDAGQTIQDYLMGSKNEDELEERINRLMGENTNNKKVNEAATMLKYGYMLNDEENKREIANVLRNMAFETAIKNARDKFRKNEEINKTAEEESVSSPIENEEIENEEIADTNDNNEEIDEEIDNDDADTEQQDDTSTGSLTDNTEDTNSSEETNDNNEQLSDEEIDNQDEEIAPTTTPQNDEVQDDVDSFSGPNIEQEDENNAIDDDIPEDDILKEREYTIYYNTADQLITQFFVKHWNDDNLKLKNIIDAYNSGNKEEFEKLLNEFNTLLHKQHPEINENFNITDGEFIKRFNELVDIINDANKDNSFTQLSKFAILGLEKINDKNANTELLTYNPIRAYKLFIREYCEKIAHTTKGGKPVISIGDLFLNLIKNKDITYADATKIYNDLYKYMDALSDEFAIIGWNALKEYDAYSFFKMLEEKADVKNVHNKMHFHFNEEDKSFDYRKAMDAIKDVVEGKKKVFLRANYNKYGEFTNIDVVVATEGKKDYYKIGTLRAVTANSDNSQFFPKRHYSGFKNSIIGNIRDESIKLDCDFLFDELCNNPNNPLYETLYNFHKAIIESQNNDDIKASITDDEAKSILNNPLIKKLLDERLYNFYDPELHLFTDGDPDVDSTGKKLNFKHSTDEYNSEQRIKAAKELLDKIGSILFYGNAKQFTKDFANFASSSLGMKMNYSNWKNAVKENYRQTMELQKSLESNGETIETSFDFTTIIKMNLSDTPVNIGSAEFTNGIETDSTSPNYTPLVMVKNGKLIDENGKNYGTPINGVQEYSIGVVAKTEEGRSYVAYLNKATDLKKQKGAEKLLSALRNEVFNLLYQYHNGTISFADVRSRFEDLIGTTSSRGLFMFDKGTFVGGKKGSPNFFINCNGVRLFTVWAPIEDKYHNIKRNIGIKFEDGHSEKNKNGSKYDITDTIVDDLVNSKEINNALDYLFGTKNHYTSNHIADNNAPIQINRSQHLFNSKRNFYYVDKSNGKFKLNLGEETLEYDSLLDMFIQNGAFETRNVVGSPTGKTLYTKQILINTVAINNTIKDTHERNYNATAVTDLIYDTKGKVKPDKKRLNIFTLLQAAGVSADIIEFMKRNELFSSKHNYFANTVTVDDYNDKEFRNAYFTEKGENGKSSIHITHKGLAAMNPNESGSNKTNALRLILHENIHRAISIKRRSNKEKTDQLISDLEEVYNYVLDKIKNSNTNTTNILYNNLFKKLEENTDKLVKLEEFLCESLTQPMLVKYLNNTMYDKGAVVSNLKNKKKSIFQKIVDFIMQIFRPNGSAEIKDNTILAREYLILSGLEDHYNPITDKVEDTPVEIEKVEESKSKTKTVVHTGRHGASVTYNVGDIIDDKKENKKYRVTAVTKDGKIISAVVIEGNDLFAESENDKLPVEEHTNTTGTIGTTNNTSVSTSSTTNTTNNTTTNTTKNSATQKDNSKTNSKPVSSIPVDTENLNAAEQQVKQIQEDFGKRIKRSENFEEDHTYYMDGKKVDISVTTEIHGDTSGEAWVQLYGPAASRLGNTADETARFYFMPEFHYDLDAAKEGNGDKKYKPINVVESDNPLVENSEGKLWDQMKFIKSYLDERFGAGKYRVVTEEFPIGGVIDSKDGTKKTIAGTMDMLVYTDKNEFYVFDFKTKRFNPNNINSTGKLTDENLRDYEQQVNMYVQILRANYPSMKVYPGGLIKFNTSYPKNENGIYDNNKKNDNQLYVTINGKTEKIQDSTVEYTAPMLVVDETKKMRENKDTFITFEKDNYKLGKIYSMPKVEDKTDVAENNSDEINDEDYDSYDDGSGDEFSAVTELLTDENIDYATSGESTSVHVQNMEDFVKSFPVQFRPNIEQLMADDLLEYYCTI